MDLITQSLLGSAVAQAGYSKKLGRRVALYGLVIGLLPDFDVISGYWGQWASLKQHRGPAHAFLPLIVMAIPIGLLCHKISGSDGKKSHWIGLAALSLITHPIIDWFTAYGTSLAWPFSDQRYAIDALPIIDPVYSLPLLVATLLGLFSRLSPQLLRSISIIALAATTLYAFVGWHTSQTLIMRGKELFKSHGFESVEVRAMPTFLNTVVYRVVGRDANDRFMITYLKKSSQQPLTGVVTVEPDRDEFVTQVLNHENGITFKWFSMNMLQPKSSKLEDGGHKVVLNDMRYGMFLEPTQTLFSAEALFDREGNLTSFTRVHNRSSVSMKKDISATLAHVFGNSPEPTQRPSGGQ